MNRQWDILLTNEAAVRVGEYLHGGSSHTSMVRQFFDPDDLRSVVVNWEKIARDLMRHLQDEITAVPSDDATRALLEEVVEYPGVPAEWRTRELGASPPPVLTVEFRKDDRSLRFFSTIATFGTARDVTVEERRVERAFPADEATEAFCRELARGGH